MIDMHIAGDTNEFGIYPFIVMHGMLYCLCDDYNRQSMRLSIAEQASDTEFATRQAEVMDELDEDCFRESIYGKEL